MNWHTATVAVDGLEPLLAVIRDAAGTIISCKPERGWVQVTWTALS